jgi:6-pyruvoyltetrahydropterin/6-carboxytetrahydropterin synthase
MNENLYQHKTRIFRREHFNAAHRLLNLSWTDAQNQEVFGKCNNVYYHGHNYELEVQVTGFVDPQTGFVMDAKVLSELIQKEVIERFDHKNLNLECSEFAQLNPSAENIAFVIYNLLRSHINPQHDLKIRLYETARNYVEYPAN